MGKDEKCEDLGRRKKLKSGKGDEYSVGREDEWDLCIQRKEGRRGLVE